MKLVCMRGYSGSGKSTRAAEIAKEIDAVIVSRDQLRKMMLNDWWTGNKADEDRVTVAEQAQVSALLRAGHSVVVDATHLNAPFLRKWARMASRLGADFDVVDVIEDVAECQRRDHQRMLAGGRYVGDTVIAQQAKRFPAKSWPTIKADPPFVIVPAPEWDFRDLAVIYDLDGTAAIHNGRNPYDYARVSEDLPNYHLRFTLDNLAKVQPHLTFIACSGRDDTCRDDTLAWLDKYAFPYDMLLMRDTENDRDGFGGKARDVEVKYRLYNEHIRGLFDVAAVFDDRLQVCRLWHELGLPLYRVGDPDADF